ncbi:hypothetical protein OPT61_g558 [Boeremia exigua]|uniref:Uncharacterized protein n=1 Tax=Boeremia exigua TaxID=749465 RepID=A0ACC2ITA5_9PLEO|nr:hypothetical protein OPT61_g558 [Boeremia exigua]
MLNVKQLRIEQHWVWVLRGWFYSDNYLASSGKYGRETTTNKPKRNNKAIQPNTAFIIRTSLAHHDNRDALTAVTDSVLANARRGIDLPIAPVMPAVKLQIHHQPTGVLSDLGSIEPVQRTNSQSIAEARIALNNAVGGSFVADGLMVEVQLDAPNSIPVARDLEIVQEKTATKLKATTPTEPKSECTTVKPGSKKDGNKMKDKTPERPLHTKAYRLKPDNGKGGSEETGNGRTGVGERNPTQIILNLISDSLRRSSRPKSCMLYTDVYAHAPLW